MGEVKFSMLQELVTNPFEYLFNSIKLQKINFFKTKHLTKPIKSENLLTSSQIFSSLGIQLVAKWQFCSTTQVPSTMAFSIIFAAIGP